MVDEKNITLDQLNWYIEKIRDDGVDAPKALIFARLVR
jgi:hypothetical protein